MTTLTFYWGRAGKEESVAQPYSNSPREPQNKQREEQNSRARSFARDHVDGDCTKGTVSLQWSVLQHYTHGVGRLEGY